MSSKFFFFLFFIIASSAGLPYTLEIMASDDSIVITNHVKPDQVSLGKLSRLYIPKINTSASIEYIGLLANGELDVPKSHVNVAWFKQGPYPGQQGNAVIIGHSGWINRTPAVFDDLDKLRKGDKIYISNDKGLKDTFIIKELRTYSEKEAVSSVFVSRDKKAHLVLITCVGDWDKINQKYSNRLVVFADREARG